MDATKETKLSALSLIWEVPLAIASRWLYVCVRLSLRWLTRWHFSRAQEDAASWRFLSAELFRHPLALPVVMTEGPRWNTHAVIARLGPLSVQETMELELATAAAAAPSWTIVVYSFPDHRTVTALGPEALAAGEGPFQLCLPAGRYSLIVRYYAPLPAAQMPAVFCDGQPTAASRAVPDTVNDFYGQLAARKTVFYCLLHYHAFVILKRSRWLPRSFVEHVYLPVGNPATRFRYGVLEPNGALEIRLGPQVLKDWHVYVTVYNLASFPVAWERVEALGCRLGSFGCRCTYLIRLHPATRADPLPDAELQVVVTTEGNDWR